MNYKWYVIITLSIILGLLLLQRCTRYLESPVKWTKDLVQQCTGQACDGNTPTLIYTSANKSYKRQFAKSQAKLLETFASRHPEVTIKHLVHADDEASPYWLRCIDLIKLLDSVTEGSYVMYLDQDAVLNPAHFSLSIGDFISSIDPGKQYDFYVSEDPMNQYSLVYPGIFNSGVYIVRNTLASRKLARKWMDGYNPDMWSRNNQGSWQCTMGKIPCPWSFTGYEQGKISELYITDILAKQVIMKLHWNVLACTDPDNISALTIHLMGHNDAERNRVFTKYLVDLSLQAQEAAGETT